MKEREKKQQQFAIRLSLAVGVIMLIGKWYAYLITNSAAILSDAAESVVHIVAVTFAAFSMWLVYQPADKSHPYGHEKVSFFSAGIEGLLIIVAAGFIIYESAIKLIYGIEIQNLDVGTYIIFGASVINLALGGFIVWRGKKTNSLILIANGKHVLTDSWTSFGVVAGLLLTILTGWLPFDPLIAIVVAINILWSGGKLVRQSVGGLMDEANPEIEKTIRECLENETRERNLRYHELRYRDAGNSLWIDFHLLFPKETLLTTAHEQSTQIELKLTQAFTQPVTIVTHLEPLEGHDKVHVGELKH
ncbi:MAG: cation transporter [Bacteroidetes bacterium]|nr:cation transporter [Bacteroidota bacterium]